jgi:SAM-dependent methyltransferase
MTKTRSPNSRGRDTRRGPRGTRQGSTRRPAATAGQAPRKRARKADASAWILRCAPGLARTVQAELRNRNVLRHTDRVDVLWQRNHDVLFLPSVATEPVSAGLRTVEEVDRCVVYGRYKISRDQLDRLAAHLHRHGKRWRLVVTAEGDHFNRHDLKRFLARELQTRGVAPDERAPRSAFAFCIDAAFYIVVPAAAADQLAGRAARVTEREGSLPPTVAAAMAFLGKPAAGDTILDPVCGSGTLLAEAAAYAPGAALVGRDLDPRAIKAARANLAGLPADLDVEDARDLDLPSTTVTLVLANLPFGKQFGDADANPELYRAFMDAMATHAAPRGWRAVLLVADPDMLDDAIAGHPVRVAKRVPIRVRGESAVIVVLHGT